MISLEPVMHEKKKLSECIFSIFEKSSFEYSSNFNLINFKFWYNWIVSLKYATCNYLLINVDEFFVKLSGLIFMMGE